MTPEAKLQQVLTDILSGSGNQKTILSIIDRLLLTYREPGRKWHNASYLWLGIKEFRRIMGNNPPRDLTLAWAYHAYVLRDLDASAVAMLHDCRDLGFTLEEADRYVSPLITNSGPGTPSSSALGDMRIIILGQKRVPYLSYARKIRQEFSFLDEEMWRLGRISGLLEMMARTPLYYRKEFEAALGTAARENMQAELNALGYLPPAPPPEEQAPTLPVVMMLPQPFIKLGDLLAATERGEKDGVPSPRPDNPPAGKEEPPARPLPGENKD